MLQEKYERVREIVRNLSQDDISKSHSGIRISKFKCFVVNLVILEIILIAYNYKYFQSVDCFFKMPDKLSHAFRTPENCDFCRTVTQIDRVSDLSSEQFEQKYAYTGRPVIVTDATVNWTASDVFSFNYLKSVQQNVFYGNEESKCQFFPYKTGFESLEDALNMPENRAKYETNTEPWYFGWSVCDYEVAHELRKHYDRPYFLPETSENNAVDWIFMGGFGLGAHMHVDNVRLPSWQAQIKGSKQWILAPPPECFYECSTFSAIVQPGDIVVLDTNKWYHKTLVESGDISITIGAEYD